MSGDHTAALPHASEAVRDRQPSLLDTPRSNRRGKPRRASDKRTQLLAHLAYGLVNRETRPLLVIDGGLNVLLSNEPAKRLLRSGNAIRIENNKLAFAEARYAKQFVRFVRQSKSVNQMSVSFSEGHAEVTVDRLTVPAQNGSAWIVRIDSSAEMKCESLRAALGLTRAETEIALALFEGRSLVRISNDRETSINTVKTQTRLIFQKCRTQSRVGLIRRLHEVMRANS